MVLTLPLLAAGQPLLSETFEAPTALVDGGGQWTDIFDVFAARSLTPQAAHRGAGGLRLTRTTPIFSDGTDTQLERVFPLRNRGPSWMRWWMRVDAA